MPSPPITQNHVAAKPHATAVYEAHMIPDSIQQYLVLISDSKHFPFELVKTMRRTRIFVPCTDNSAPSNFSSICDICLCTTHQGSIPVGFCCLCRCVKNIVEAPRHFGGLADSTIAAPSIEIGSIVLHLFAENALVPITSTFIPATHMPSDGSKFLHASNVVLLNFLKNKYQPRRCTNDDSAGQHLLVHFGSPLHFDNTPQISPMHRSDDVVTTGIFAKGNIECIALHLIAHGNKDLWTGSRTLVPQISHGTRLRNSYYGSRCVADPALIM